MMCTAACPSRAGETQGGVGLGLRDWSNRCGIESTRFHGPNVVISKVVRKVSDVEAVQRMATVQDVLLMLVVVLGS